MKVLVEGLERGRALEFREESGYLRVVVKLVPAPRSRAAGDRGDSMSEGDRPCSSSTSSSRTTCTTTPCWRRCASKTPASWPTRSRRTSRSPVEEKQNLLEIVSAQERLARIGSHPGGRGRQAARRPPHPGPRQEADGARPEGVLPQREDEGDPEGAGSQGRPRQRGRRAAQEDRAGAHAEGRRGEGAAGAEAARGDAADVGRGHGLAQLPRLAHRRALDQARPASARTCKRPSGS